VSIRNRVVALAVAVGVTIGLLPANPAAATELAPCTASVTMTRWGGPWAPNTGIVANFYVTNIYIPDITNFRIAFTSAKVTSVSARWGETIRYYNSGSRTVWVVSPHRGNPDADPPVPPEDPAFPPQRTLEFGFQGELAGQLVTAPLETLITKVSVAGQTCALFHYEV
jgi:hypothetical protein